jgi:predicted enzyme related to lactoylglutathione lyase
MARLLVSILTILLVLSGVILQAHQLELTAAEISSAAQELFEEAEEIYLQGDYERAIEFYKLSAQAAQKEMVRGTQGEALAQVARCYLKLNQKEEGRHWLTMAQEVVTDQMPMAWSRYLGVRGRYEWKDDQLEKATETFQEMYRYCLQHELHERAVDAAHMVAITAPQEEQIVWGKKGIEAAEKGNIEGWLGPLWNNLGWTYEEMGSYEESRDALVKAREYHWKLGSEMNKLIADWSVGHAHRMAGQLDEAARWMRPVLAWSERLYALEASGDAAEWIGHSCRELGELALKQEESAEALDYFRRAKEMLGQAGMSEWDPEGFIELSGKIEELAAGLPAEVASRTVVHFEIPFEEQGRATSFYRQLFGWEITGIPEMDYWMINTVPVDERGLPLEPGVNGGMMRRVVPEQQIIMYIAVESVDECVEQAIELGGSVIVPKTVIPGMGWFAHLADTERNPIGIFQDDPGAQ